MCWRFPLHRKISLAVILALLTALGALNLACSRSSPSDTEDGYDLDDREDSLSFNLNDPKIQQRLGEDDGYAFALMYSADTHGSLETCG